MVNAAVVYREKCDNPHKAYLPGSLLRAVRTFALSHGYSVNRAVIVLLVRGLQRGESDG